mmetsp:Transcript_1504/g.3910  ORF Transcript_1504/g.3910 Transcript_1504/m.3910 type:complete len:97 (+) Transcript_1504:1253-1543(+)
MVQSCKDDRLLRFLIPVFCAFLYSFQQQFEITQIETNTGTIDVTNENKLLFGILKASGKTVECVAVRLAKNQTHLLRSSREKSLTIHVQKVRLVVW